MFTLPTQLPLCTFTGLLGLAGRIEAVGLRGLSITSALNIQYCESTSLAPMSTAF